MSWFIKCLKQYADFSGRARRKEYWYFVLFAAIISVISYGLDWIFNTQITYPYFNSGWFSIIVGALLILPNLSVIVRRLHDVNKSAWFLVIILTLASILFYLFNFNNNSLTILIIAGFIYLIFDVWMIVLLVKDSFPGVNKWGPNPKGIGNEVSKPEVIPNTENVIVAEPDEKENNNIV